MPEDWGFVTCGVCRIPPPVPPLPEPKQFRPFPLKYAKQTREARK